MSVDTSHLDLLAMIPGSFKRVGRSSGGEYAGPCPFCGGRDRFHIWPANKTPNWWCRSCDKKGDAITFVCEYENLDFREACRRLGLDGSLDATYQREDRPARLPSPACPPSDLWQNEAIAFVERCEAALWDDGYQRPLEYMRKRGFKDDTLRSARIGYNAGAGEGGDKLYVARQSWGLPNEEYTDDNGNKRIKKSIWLPRGIVIPWFAGGKLWSVLIRRPTGDPKYYFVPGKGNAPYGIDLVDPGKPVVLVESAMDALAIQQAAGDLVVAVATGTTGARDAQWIARIAGCCDILLAFDDDAAGEQAADYWQGIFTDGVRQRPVPDDPATMLQRGLNLRAWVSRGLKQCHRKHQDELIAALHDLHRQIAALGYKTDALHWLDNADLDELQTYVAGQREYLDWCQQHRAAVQRVWRAWAAERAKGHDNPKEELVLAMEGQDTADLVALAERIEARTVNVPQHPRLSEQIAPAHPAAGGQGANGSQSFTSPSNRQIRVAQRVTGYRGTTARPNRLASVPGYVHWNAGGSWYAATAHAPQTSVINDARSEKAAVAACKEHAQKRKENAV